MPFPGVRWGGSGRCLVKEPSPSTGQAPEALSDRLVTPERSVFGTRLPRPVGVGRHLLVVFVLSLVALGVAILFAEREGSDPVPSKDRFKERAAGQ